VYYAILNLLRLANPLAIVVATLITPAAAAARNMHRAKMVTLRFTLIGAALMVPYLAALVLLPQHSIALAYGWDSQFLSYSSVVQVFAISVAFVYAAGVAGALLNGVERSRLSFIGQMTYAAGFLFIAMPLTALYGMPGAAWGWFIAAALRAAVNIHYALGLPSDQRDEEISSDNNPMPQMELAAAQHS